MNDLQTVDEPHFQAYARTGLDKMEAPFKKFFDAYAQYQADLAQWQAHYGAALVTVTPTDAQRAALEASARAGQVAAKP